MRVSNRIILLSFLLLGGISGCHSTAQNKSSRSFTVDTKVIDQYIDDLMTKSTAEIPVWNIEKARAGSKSGWDYIDGCMIMAILELYDTSKNEKFLKFADYYEDYRIHDDGTIDGYSKAAWNIDEINGGKNLFPLYSLTKKEKYRLALEKLYEQVKEQPRTKEGNFWHKAIYPHQVWLDGRIRRFILIRFGSTAFIWVYPSIWNTRRPSRTAKTRTTSTSSFLMSSAL